MCYAAIFLRSTSPCPWICRFSARHSNDHSLCKVSGRQPTSLRRVLQVSQIYVSHLRYSRESLEGMYRNPKIACWFGKEEKTSPLSPAVGVCELYPGLLFSCVSWGGGRGSQHYWIFHSLLNLILFVARSSSLSISTRRCPEGAAEGCPAEGEFPVAPSQRRGCHGTWLPPLPASLPVGSTPEVGGGTARTGSALAGLERLSSS